MDLNEVVVFIKVIQSGSFSGAAIKLGMPVSTVSFKVSSLEKRLGLTLIQRTTRKLHITPVGEVYYKKCVEGMASIEAAEIEVASTQSEPSGLLRLTTYNEVAGSILPGIISQYTERYPKVRIEVLVTDRVVDLISENVDLAIRAGELKDSGLIARKIGTSCFGMYSSPKYLKLHKAPTHPRELIQHQTLQFTPFGVEEWKLLGPTGAPINARLHGRVLMNDLIGLKSMALAGDGIALLPTYFVVNEVREKKLVRVLPDWHTRMSSAHFVYPSQKFVTPKLSAFIGLAMATLKKSFESFES
jgi:DNA-binding transcriptional LysR family regulator